ncbi:peptidylprolyl isomerase [Geomonas paludis]|uniref:Peptidylprolyl isomerase n=1 Tax=Geomonas paludis TaxID=2740185 RepID=A0A6V8MX12_9BACT|nr:peptidylprolyl isomerase [Geomonas paludis]UPU37147.1 peptidylprolyl isomerase [Geomonas paludis]GFO64755.1 peptidylprolyl isomerase [Geomonas paludis]
MHYHRLAPNSLLALCLVAALSGCAGMNTSTEKSAAPTAAVTPTPPAGASEIAPVDNGRDVVARVNGSAITRNELERSKKILLAGGVQVAPYMQKEFEKQALDQLISAELLYQGGKGLEVKDLDKQADAKLAQIKSGFKDPKAFEKELENIKMTESMLREYSRRDLVIANFVSTKVAPDVKVSEEEIKKFYDDNPDKFLQQEQVRVSHILIGADAKATPEEKKKAREKADELQKKIAAGADFAAAAKDNSTCPSSNAGGDLGYFGKGKMVPAFEQAAFALQPGEVSGVVETEYGYHIIKQTDRIKADKVSLSVAKEKIEGYLKAQKINQAMAQYVGKARQDAKIDFLLK